jgi:hypothetical protein
MYRSVNAAQQADEPERAQPSWSIPVGAVARPVILSFCGHSFDRELLHDPQILIIVFRSRTE